MYSIPFWTDKSLQHHRQHRSAATAQMEEPESEIQKAVHHMEATAWQHHLLSRSLMVITFHALSAIAFVLVSLALALLIVVQWHARCLKCSVRQEKNTTAPFLQRDRNCPVLSGLCNKKTQLPSFKCPMQQKNATAPHFLQQVCDSFHEQSLF